MEKRILLLFAFFFVLSWSFAQTVYEDFESGTATLPWQALDGTFDGVVDNPTPNAVNGSAKCGSYTKSNTHSYSLFLADLGTPMDLSTNNQFSIQIYTAAPTQVLLKLEGPGGAIEATRNIVNANVWQEYHFDFSAAAANTGLTKIILFFDPGVETSGDTYLFDNLVANPAGPCAGTAIVPTTIDDFECQRNASYGGGWDILSAVANPDASGINTSAGVGRYVDPLDEWSALVIDYQNPIDLTTNNYIRCKIWSPKNGQVLIKLEGGASAPVEKFIPIPATNTWVEYAADFSPQAGGNYKKISIFFNAGVLAETGDIYYIDDIERIPKPAPGPIEDFEPQKLSWEPLNGDQAIHGTFGGAVNNPDQTGVNDSPMVGTYTKGSSPFSTLTAPLPNGLDLSEYPQLNMQVRAPAGSTSVTLQLQSATQGVKQRTDDITTPGTWEELNFDFSDFSDVSDFEQVNILFDAGTASSSTYLFDNLRQFVSTVDPCEGVEPIANLLDDFECQRNVTYGAGGDILTVVNNPEISLANSSLKVGKYADPQDEWSALVLDFGQTIDLSVYNQFNIKIWSSKQVPVLFKLEGGSSAPVEIFSNITTTEDWVKYEVDFSAHAGEDHTRVAIFFNAGVAHNTNDDYFIDDLRWSRTNYTACVMDFQTALTSFPNWRYFANGSVPDDQAIEFVDNPSPGGVNSSSKVAAFVEGANGEIFGGGYSNLEAPIILPAANKTMSMDVLMDHNARVVFKLEGGPGNENSGDVFADYDAANAWKRMTWNFSSVPDVPYSRVVVIMDFDNAPAVEKTYYFDNIAVADAQCLATGVRDLHVDQLRIMPNPTFNEVYVQNAEDLYRFELVNLFGQRVQLLQTTGQSMPTIELGDLASGVYILNGYNREGVLTASGKVVKQ